MSSRQKSRKQRKDVQEQRTIVALQEQASCKEPANLTPFRQKKKRKRKHNIISLSVSIRVDPVGSSTKEFISPSPLVRKMHDTAPSDEDSQHYLIEEADRDDQVHNGTTKRSASTSGASTFPLRSK